MKQQKFYESLAFHLSTAGRHLNYCFDKLIKKEGHDITVDQYSILVVLREDDGMTQTELTEHLLKTKASMTRMITIMERNEFVYRKSGSDARNKEVYLSKKGCYILERMTSLTQSYHAYFFDFLSDKEKNNFETILKKIKEKE